jgi:hypothetical protein
MKSFLKFIAKLFGIAEEIKDESEPKAEDAPSPAPPTSHEDHPEDVVEVRPVSLPAPGSVSVLAPSGGFLWKPISENSGGLIVLLPSKYTGHVSSVEIRMNKSLVVRDDKLHQRLTKLGVYNGGREHWVARSPVKKGADFTTDRHVWVLARMKNGSGLAWKITDGSKRNE